MQALSQLSYSPGKFEIYRKIETGSLTIFRRHQPEIDASAAGHQLAGEKVAPVQFKAVDRHEVDLVLGVVAPLVTGGRAPRTCEVDAQHRPLVAKISPLALNPQELSADLERNVITAVLYARRSTGTFSRVAAAVMAVSAIPPFWFVDSTNACSHDGRTESG
jgi:hypothetical protein